MIICKICKAEFKSTISWKHLKQHDITVAEYKKLYGDVVSDEYKELKRVQSLGQNNPNYGKKHRWTDDQRNRKKGSVPHNKGIPMSDANKQHLQQLAIERNKIWRESNTNPNTGLKRSEECKQKIREARKSQIITNDQVQKALNTKRINGYNLAFFKGRKHSEESKKKISEKSILSNKIKSDTANKERMSRLSEYGYTMVNEIGKSIYLRCINGHDFTRSKQYTTISKFDPQMCPICFPPISGTSNAEDEIYQFISKYTNVIRGNRTLISPKELDMFLPDYNIAIEYHGLYWHSEIYKDSTYHKEKLQLCSNNGIRLIQIFEDEWINKSDIVKARLLSFLDHNVKIPARKCVVKELESHESNIFLNNYHIQGKGRANVHLGLYYNDELVSIMTFLNGDISKNTHGWELNRFCSKSGMNITGGASKLFSAFIKRYSPESITSFADLRWCSANPVYLKLGFQRKENTAPNYWYFKTNEPIRYHRYSLRKPMGSVLSERELRRQEGWLRIYDCGSSKFVWTKKSSP